MREKKIAKIDDIGRVCVVIDWVVIFSYLGFDVFDFFFQELV